MPKTLLCRCEDVTAQDLKKAFAAGYRDLESLKRFTGFATGFCQGKSCLCQAARLLASLAGGDGAVADPTRVRPPLHPTSFARLAGGELQPVGSPAEGQQP